MSSSVRVEMEKSSITVLAISLSITGISAIAQSPIDSGNTISIESSFEDVFDELKNAIIAEGLTIEYIGNVDQLLERTARVNISEDTEHVIPVYHYAKYLQFCSSVLTHKAVKADPENLSMCPFLVFIYETRADPGRIVIGYRPPTLGSDKESTVVSQEVDLSREAHTHFHSPLLLPFLILFQVLESFEA
jgi:uncharacterized protein (DUF302 family)